MTKNLKIRQHALDQSLVSGMNLQHRAKLTLTLGAFLGQNMAFEGLLVLHAVGGFLETLCRTADSFNLRH